MRADGEITGLHRMITWYMQDSRPVCRDRQTGMYRMVSLYLQNGTLPNVYFKQADWFFLKVIQPGS